MSMCIVCKSPAEGSMCPSCQKSISSRKNRAKGQSPAREEHTGLADIEKVMEEDRQKIERQAKRRKPSHAVAPE